MWLGCIFTWKTERAEDREPCFLFLSWTQGGSPMLSFWSLKWNTQKREAGHPPGRAMSEFLSFHVLTDHHLLAATQGSCLFTSHFARGRILTHSSGLFIVPNPGVCSVSYPVVKQPSHPKNRRGGGDLQKKKKKSFASSSQPRRSERMH